MSIGKMLVEAINEQWEEETTVEVRVGRISKELQDEFKANRKKHQAEHDEIKAKIDAYIESLQKEHSCRKFKDIDSELWEKAYDELGLTESERGLSYTIHDGDRVVFRNDEIEDEIEDSKKVTGVAMH